MSAILLLIRLRPHPDEIAAKSREALSEIKDFEKSVSEFRDIVPGPLVETGHNLRSSLERAGLPGNLWPNCVQLDSPVMGAMRYREIFAQRMV